MATSSLVHDLIHKFVNEPLPLPYEQIPMLNKARNYILNFTFERDDPFRMNQFFPTTFVPIALYLVITFALKKIFKGRPLDFKTNPLLYAFGFAHNVILSLGSLIMFAGMMYGFLQVAFTSYLANETPGQSFLIGICNSNGTFWNNRYGTAFWIWVFMVSKWWEFIDTFLLCLKDKPLQFLHVWHHATVPLHMYLMLISEWDPAVFGFCFNAFVHIIMYYYYLQQYRGIDCWWKKLVTIIQIVQFVVCFVILGVSMNSQHCELDSQSSRIALSSTFTLYLSYLVLFIKFYASAYSKKGRRSTGDKKVEAEEKKMQ
ncbi:hypothetical protein FDP41_004480 [Naegleria fowleri]|uniref:Elongation of fatty acids protein n=1 Tax=Naegleria fowleri TaxID=5763 RepID=A0A6A5BQQ3_NAEFO|nr:uncharacterized protein FDP41_004480 [Naegleria fowleri]KAF0976581.1 hypothetical protein FDP41_004480 [Naegleria fowleri]